MPEVRGFPTVLRRHFFILHATFLRGRMPYPKTADALRRLREAIYAEVPCGRGLKRKRERPAMRSSPTTGHASRKHYQRMLRLKKDNVQLRAEVVSHTQSKAEGWQLSPEWLSRVFLTSPAASARGMAQSFRDVVCSDSNTVSRYSIGRVRDAWVELYKVMVFKVGADMVADAVGAATGAEFVPLYILHVQDEADIRLRSGDALDGPAIPRRSRASKVQQNVVELVTDAGNLEIPTELEALGDKTAATLATCFERLLRSIAASVLPPTGGDGQPQAAA